MNLGGMIRRLDAIGRCVEDVLLATLLSAMILLAGWQIVQRNLLGGGMIWGDQLLRLLVLWLGLLGAMAASRDDRHIAIDLLLRFVAARFKPAMKVFLHLFTAIICALLAWYCWSFVQMEREFATKVLGGLPAWWFELILPLGFGVMSLRYLGHLRRILFALPAEETRAA